MTGLEAGGSTASSAKHELINSAARQTAFPKQGGSGSSVKEEGGNNMGAADHL